MGLPEFGKTIFPLRFLAIFLTPKFPFGGGYILTAKSRPSIPPISGIQKAKPQRGAKGVFEMSSRNM
ncbi:MAG: hypothetical protein A2X66_09070 [Ignavibacteria bacterium GWA2_54_16]|nr:MAG: hypothetical protein A2X66_09070 [Ignavibacteria bacterium GWA2_54_16]